MKHMNFVQTAECDRLPWQPEGLIHHKGDEAETLQKCS